MTAKQPEGSGSGDALEQHGADSEAASGSTAADAPELTIVGIGASAGGLAALRVLLADLPRDAGLALVVVVHLSPEHESHLADLLQPHCNMPVQRIEQDMALEPNHVYVIPPNRNLSTIDTHLRLSELEERRRERAPIDHFFRTLARTHDGGSIGVVLTGTGSDGTLGLRRIKETGGVTIAQDPEEAEYDGMPRSAIGSGMVDLVLPLQEIGRKLVELAEVQLRAPAREQTEELDADENRLLQKIFAQLRARTGHDFSQYKRSTIMRRIQRRMQLQQIPTLLAYLERLREDRQEAKDLFHDLLITVTEFFRDRHVFDRLKEQVIPQLFEGKTSEDRIRVWSVGCSTGEEAYSLAMLLIEESGRRDEHPQLQVFASDLHEQSLTAAREGLYPAEIASDVSPERLSRFFSKENGQFRVRREVREMVVFAPHNLLGDPPFSHQDLIVCRNVLIYLQRDVQQDVVSVFHYALKERGLLLLGTSETVDRSELFTCEDKESCLYRKRNGPAKEPRWPMFPISPARRSGAREEEPAVVHPGPRPTYGAMHERMVERYGPPSVLMDPDGEVVHCSASAGRFMVLPGGELTRDIFKLVRPPLSVELRSAVHTARQTGEPARSRPVEVRFNGESGRVALRVHPSTDPDLAGYLLVVFDEVLEPPALDLDPGADAEHPHAATVRELEAELQINRQRLQATIEEYDSSREEMQASNEELQSANEELRSTMEELETSKEELQSMNEELTTVSQENRHRVEELAQLADDLQNLLAATDIATIFLDRELRIVRFTPQVAALFNIRHTDKGRPLTDLTHRLGYDGLQADARRVLDRLERIEHEVQDGDGRWYLARILPYRAGDDRIDGVVITLIDITDRRAAESKLRESEERLRALVIASSNVVYLMSPDWQEMRHLEGQHFLADHTDADEAWLDKYIPADEQPRVREAIERAVDAKETFDLEHQVIRIDGSVGWIWSRAVPIFDDQGRIIEWFGSASDITGRRRAAEELTQAKDYAESIVTTLHEPLLVLNPDLTVRTVNEAFFEHFQVTPEETIGRKVYDLGNGQWDIPALRTLLEDVLPDSNVFNDYEVQHHFEDIGDRVMLLNARRLDHVQLILLGIRDITARKRTEDALRSARDELEQRVTARTSELEQQAIRLRDLASELASAERRERKRLAALLHDGLQQLLVAAKMRLNLARGQTMDANALKAVDSVTGMIDEAVEASRDLTRQLRPPVLYEDGLVPALRWLAGEFDEKHGLTVEIDAPEAPVHLDDDAGSLLYEAVRELLFNIVKHAAVEQATVRVHRAEDQLQVIVADQGAGFDQASRRPGAGLGLFSVRERLVALGGRLEVQSMPGEGTRATLTIPLSPTGAVRATTEQLREAVKLLDVHDAADRAAQASRDVTTVLVVDDHVIVRQGIATVLAEEDALLVVGEAGDGETAIAAVERFQPDVVLMDANLPGINGMQATREIRRRWPGVRVIGMSVHADEATRRSMCDAGACAFVPKSEDFDRMVAAILEE